MDRAVAEVISAHEAAGQRFTAAGVRSFVRAEGDGDPVVLVHGLPASSFLYRKVLPELAGRGLRGIAFDLPGLGLAERPVDFDYSISGLGRFATAAVDALGLDRFHLVVHDAGGPVGFELAGRQPDRIRSLTILNTVVELTGKPFPGEVYARLSQRVHRGVLSPRVWRAIMLRVGILDPNALSTVELDAYRELAFGSDDGAAYLQIMRSIRPPDGPRGYDHVVGAGRVPYPVQLVWGASDPILPLTKHGYRALRATGLASMTVLPARHYLQEDQAPQVAALVASFVQG